MKKVLFALMLLCVPFMASAQGTTKGYRGFIDLTYIGSLDRVQDNPANSTLWATGSFGYNVIDQLFIGGGAGICDDLEGGKIGLPVFGQVRFDFPVSDTVGFYAGVKAGYKWFSARGAFYTPSVGVRIRCSEAAAFNIGLDFMTQNVEAQKCYNSGLGVTIGFDFQ